MRAIHTTSNKIKHSRETAIPEYLPISNKVNHNNNHEQA